jgi:hypothetical protein
MSTSSGADSARRASSYTSLESFPFLNFLKACSSAAISSHSPWNFLYLGGGGGNDGDGDGDDDEVANMRAVMRRKREDGDFDGGDEGEEDYIGGGSDDDDDGD